MDDDMSAVMSVLAVCVRLLTPVRNSSTIELMFEFMRKTLIVMATSEPVPKTAKAANKAVGTLHVVVESFFVTCDVADGLTRTRDCTILCFLFNKLDVQKNIDCTKWNT